MDREPLQRHLAQTERHIAQGEVHLARQRLLIAGLHRAGHDTEEARAVLDTLMETQVLHEQDREHLLGLVSQAGHGATTDRSKPYPPGSIRQQDAQRWARLWEMEQRAIALLRYPVPDTFLGRQHGGASVLLHHEQP